MSRTAQFVTLAVEDDVFAVPVESVQEILDVIPVARVPHAPDYLLGMIDVRGQSHPVIDLRIRLGLDPAKRSDATRIVILNASKGGSPSTLGLLAERVFEVAEIDDGSMEAPPDINGPEGRIPVAGIARRKGRLVMIFDLERLLAPAEIGAGASRAA